MKIRFMIIIALFLTAGTYAACSLDHLLIGCNPDGDPNTIADNNTLFFDCSQKYRHTPDNWQADYYTIPLSFFGDYRLGEPGVDVITSGVHAISGTKLTDYHIMIECTGISDDITVLNGTQVVISQIDDTIDHSSLSDSHVHLTYYVPDAAGAAKLQWVSLRLYDQLGTYQPSEPCTLVFCQKPQSCDIAIDGYVDTNDIISFCDKWLMENADKSNDFYERADINRDGIIDIIDFVVIHQQWNNSD